MIRTYLFAADEYAADEIENLAAQLATAAKTRNDRLQDADLAASALALPQTRLRPTDPG